MVEFNSILCGIILPVFLLGAGIFFAIKLRFFYILKPISTLKSIIFCKGGFSSLCVALAGTLGVGNIVGVSSAVIGGGYGSIFWMWLSAFLSMSLKYTEVTLAMNHRRVKDGKYYGGAPYYIYEGFKKRIRSEKAFLLGSIFAILCAINSLSTGNLVQSNAASELFNVPKITFGLVFALLALLVVCRGIKRISKFSSILMPILSILYIAMCLYIIISNIHKIPSAFTTIIKEAFNIKSVFFGVGGYGITRAMRFGISRGLLSNEAGCGTSPCAHASSSQENQHAQGCLGVFEVFFDTIVLCTLTSLVIIISSPKQTDNALSLITDAFEKHLGSFGRYGVLICCLLFAFATVVTQYFYGIESLQFIKRSRFIKIAFSLVFFLVTIFSALIPMSIMWEISDFVLALMTIFNIICLLFLQREI